MPSDDELIALERAAWEALTTSGEAAARFYDKTLAKSVLMLLPGGLVIDDRAKVVESMSGPPWASFALSDERVLWLTGESAVVAYKANAQRGDMDYTALLNSTYVREGGEWRLALHQQTPL